MNKNVVAFNKKAIVCPDNDQANHGMVATINSELMQYGYILTEDTFNALAKSDPTFIKNWAADVFTYLEKYLPTGVKYTPLHRGFPGTVKAMSHYEIYLTQIISYWTDGKLVPFEHENTKYHYEHVKYRELTVMTKKEFDQIFTVLTSLNAGLASKDTETIDWFLANYTKDQLNDLMPERVPFKEMLTKLAVNKLDVPIKTTTDVLRIAAVMSYGDADITVPPKTTKKYRYSKAEPNPEYDKKKWKLTSSQGKYIMSLLDRVHNGNDYVLSEMILKRMRWVTLAKHIYAGQYKNKYPFAFKAIQVMRQKNDYPKSWYGHVATAFSKSFKKGVNKLAERPGEFIRRVDWMIRSSLTKPKRMTHVFTKFQEVAIKSSNKVLFELWTHFESRVDKQTVRKVWTGEKRSAISLPLLDGLGENIVNQVIEIIWQALYEKFKSLDSLGTTWIDPELKKIPLPTNMKTLTDSLEIVIRGQRNPIGDKRYCLFYCLWEGRTDLDFSVTTTYKSKSINKVGYGGNGYKADSNNILHSGDNTGNYDYNSELVSIDLENTTAKWAVAVVNVFRGGLEQCNGKLGIMTRDDVLQSRNWKPKTAVSALSVKSSATSIAVLAVDIEKREWILIDEDAAKVQVSDPTKVLEYIKSIAEEPKFSVYDLLKLHADARGIFVDEIEPDTQTIFKYDDFSTTYEKTLEYML